MDIQPPLDNSHLLLSVQREPAFRKSQLDCADPAKLFKSRDFSSPSSSLTVISSPVDLPPAGSPNYPRRIKTNGSFTKIANFKADTLPSVRSQRQSDGQIDTTQKTARGESLQTVFVRETVIASVEHVQDPDYGLDCGSLHEEPKAGDDCRILPDPAAQKKPTSSSCGDLFNGDDNFSQSDYVFTFPRNHSSSSHLSPSSSSRSTSQRTSELGLISGATTLQSLAQMNIQLKELDVLQSESKMELAMEQALLQAECDLLTQTIDEKRTRYDQLMEGNRDELSQYDQMNDTLEEVKAEMQLLHHDMLADSTPVSRENYAQKRAQFDNLEYRILELQALQQEEDELLQEIKDAETELQQLQEQIQTIRHQSMSQTQNFTLQRHDILSCLSPSNDHSPQINRIPPCNTVGNSDANGMSFLRNRSDRGQRPLTRYFPQLNVQMHLGDYLESCGHDLESWRKVVLVDADRCCGYLRKLSTRGLVPIWTKRWFVFDRSDKTLAYFTDKSIKKKVVGVLRFEDILDVFVEHDKSKKDSVFCIRTTQRTYTLQAANSCVMRIWVESVATGADANSEYCSYRDELSAAYGACE